MSSLRLIAPVFVAVVYIACTDSASSTDLHTAGPPKVEQVRLLEDFVDASSNDEQRTVFAFGTAPPNSNATSADEHPVTTAAPIGQKLRVIMDQLVEGNNLEMISCAAPISADGPWSRVPEGATPDDIASCSVALDVLPATCKGVHAVCICQLAAGCPVGTETVPMGKPVGVLDTNMDGAADDTEFIKGAVHIMCNGIDVPLDVQNSYWNPSGFQEVPAKGGFDALGPAIVLVPDVAPGTMAGQLPVAVLPTNTTCGLTFDPSVVNPRHQQVCIPAGGDPNLDCTPPDTSAFSFQVEPLAVTVNGFTEGGMVGNMDLLLFKTNAPLDQATLSTVTITQGAGNTPFTDFQVVLQAGAGIVADSIILEPGAAGWPTGSTFILTFPTTVHDAYGQAPPMAAVFHFST